MSLTTISKSAQLALIIGIPATAAMAAQPGGGVGGATKSPPALVWVDATGKQVGRDRGTYLERNGVVIASIQGSFVGLLLTDDDNPGQATWQRSTWYYATPDCSGDPTGAGNSPFRATGQFEAGVYAARGMTEITAIHFDQVSGHHFLYYLDGSNPLYTFGSLEEAGYCYSADKYPAGVSWPWVVKAGPIVDLDTLFQLPFTLQ